MKLEILQQDDARQYLYDYVYYFLQADSHISHHGAHSTLARFVPPNSDFSIFMKSVRGEATP